MTARHQTSSSESVSVNIAQLGAQIAGLGLHTPHDVHHGLAEMRRAQRALVLQTAYAEHPERFVHKSPTPPAAAWINKPKPLLLTEEVAL